MTPIPNPGLTRRRVLQVLGGGAAVLYRPRAFARQEPVRLEAVVGSPLIGDTYLPQRLLFNQARNPENGRKSLRETLARRASRLALERSYNSPDPLAAASLTIAGVLHGASWTTNQFTPGQWATLFLTTALADAAYAAPSVPLPRTLGKVAISVGGIDAPLNYVSPNQANFQIPCELGLAPTSVQVTINAQTSSPFTIPLLAAAPGVFWLDAYRLPVAQRWPDLALPGFGAPIGPWTTTPWTTGEVWSLYLTGLPTNGLIRSGEDAGLQNGQPIYVPGVLALLDGAPIETLAAAWCPGPGMVAVQQVALRVPQVTRGVHALTVTSNGVTSAPTYVPIAVDNTPFAAGRLAFSDNTTRDASVTISNPDRTLSEQGSSLGGTYLTYLPGRPSQRGSLDSLLADLNNPDCYPIVGQSVSVDKASGNSVGAHYLIARFQDTNAHFRFQTANIDPTKDLLTQYFVADPNSNFDLMDWLRWAQVWDVACIPSNASGSSTWRNRFPSTQGSPIKVFLNPAQAPSGAIDYLRQGLRAWDYQGRQRFTEVAYDPTGVLGDQGVQVEYDPTVTEGGGGVFRRDADSIIQGIVSIGTYQSGVRLISLENVLIHELGHVLGLRHAPDRNNVMYPIGPSSSVVESPNEMCQRLADVLQRRPLVPLDISIYTN